MKRSAHALNRMHREHISRDQESLRTINADVAKLRSAIQGLNAELQPQLQRLTMAELAGSGFRSNISAPAFVRTLPSQAMVTAATRLQACWRTRRATSHSQSALASLDYCPPSVRRNFLLGVRQPFLAAQPRTTASVEAALATPVHAIPSAKGVMKPAGLHEYWAAAASKLGASAFPTFEFHGHDDSAGAKRYFSNHEVHEPFGFVVPISCGAPELLAAGRPARVSVTSAEKAIMLCKASAMGDLATYDRIAVASAPHECKELGRAVTPFIPAKWDAVVCEVAKSAMLQKFRSVAGLDEMLLATGNRVIALMENERTDMGHRPRSRPRRRQPPRAVARNQPAWLGSHRSSGNHSSGPGRLDE